MTQPTTPPLDPDLGDTVKHKWHGEGVVRDVKPSSGGLQCRVEFKCGSQWVYASMVRVTKRAAKAEA